MKKIILLICLVLLQCEDRHKYDSKSRKIADDDAYEVCLKGVVYYRSTGYGGVYIYSPKFLPNSLVEKCN